MELNYTETTGPVYRVGVLAIPFGASEEDISEFAREQIGTSETPTDINWIPGDDVAEVSFEVAMLV